MALNAREAASFTCDINGKIVEFVHIPKCGGTSVKTMMLEASGFDWQNSPASDWGLPANQRKYMKENRRFIGQFKKNKYNRRVDYTFTVIRDPVSRMISAYTNRVLYYKKIPDPGWDKFIRMMPNWPNFDIKHHTQLMCVHIGTNPQSYNAVFTTSEIGTKVSRFLSEIADKEVKPLERQRGGTEKKHKIIPTEEQINKIKTRYQKDYDIWWNKEVVPQAFE